MTVHVIAILAIEFLEYFQFSSFSFSSCTQTYKFVYAWADISCTGSNRREIVIKKTNRKYLFGTGDKVGEKEKKKENKNNRVHASEVSPMKNFVSLHFFVLLLFLYFGIFHH